MKKLAKNSKTKQNIEHRTQNTDSVISGQWSVATKAQRHLSASQTRQAGKGTKDSAKCEVQSIKTTHHAPGTTHHALSIIYCLLPILLLVISILLAYSNTFNASFHLDDEPNIIINDQIKNLSNLSEVIRDTDRPVAMIVNALNYHFGKLNVRGYHYVNTGIHILTVIVLYFILLNTFSLPSLAGKYSDKKYFLAMSTSLIFALHPLQTQAITYIIQGRMAGLATLFYLSALLFFILGYKKNRNYELRITNEKSTNRQSTIDNSPPSAFSLQPSALFYILAILSSALGMGTKEITVTAPLVILIYDYFLISDSNLSELRKRLLIHIGLFLTTAVVIYFTVTCTKFGISSGFGVKDFTPLQYLFTQFRVVLYYAFLLLFPLNQNVDYDWHISKSFFEPFTLICFIIIVLVLFIAIKIYKKQKLLTFCILWFFITIAPESSIVPNLDVIFEHRMYLPSAFSILFFVLLLDSSLVFFKSKNKNKATYLGYFIILFISLILGTLTYWRNTVWIDEEVFWKDCVRKSPNKGRPYNNLAIVYNKAGRFDDSIPILQKGIKAAPDFAPLYNNLGLAYNELGHPEKALPILHKAIKLAPDRADPYTNTGISYARLGRFQSATKFFKKALKINPANPEYYNNLANTYLDSGKTETAVNLFKKAIKIYPNFASYRSLGEIYEKEGKYQLALKSYKKMLTVVPNYGEGYVIVGMLYINKLRDAQKSIYYLKKALNYLPLQESEKIKDVITQIKTAIPQSERFISEQSEPKKTIPQIKYYQH